MSATTREEIRIGQLAIRFLVEGDASDGAVAVFEFDVPAGARLPIAHSHDGDQETIYGLNGVLTWTVDGTATAVGPGEAICILVGALFTVSTTTETSTRPGSGSPLPASSGLTISGEIAAVLQAAAEGLSRSRRARRRHAPSRHHPCALTPNRRRKVHASCP